MGRKDLDKKKHQALLREHQKIKALKKKGKVVVKGKKKNIGYFETQKEDQEEKYQKKGKPQQRKPKKQTKKKKQNNNKKAKKASQKKKSPKKGKKVAQISNVEKHTLHLQRVSKKTSEQRNFSTKGCSTP